MSASAVTGPELYLLETRRDRTRGLTQLQGACRPHSSFYACVYGTAFCFLQCKRGALTGSTWYGQERG